MMRMKTRLFVGAALLAATAIPAFANDAGTISPRRPLRKTPTDRLVVPRAPDGTIVSTGRLVVKFHDSVQARTSRAANDRVTSLSNENMSAVDEVIARNRVTVRQAINRTPQQIRAVELKAQDRSRRGQPDLAGMMFVEGSLETLEVVAKELNALPNIEWVQFEQEMVTTKPKPSPAPLPAPGEDLSCATSGQDCFAPGEEPFCGDFACCTLVGTINPNCVLLDFGQWDAFCVDLANLFCQDGDKCKTPLTNGGCYEAHPTAGCNNEACCNTVCDVLSYCCTLTWDDTCAVTASQLCGTPGDGDTPDFTMTAEDTANRWQKYMSAAPSVKGDAFYDAFFFSGEGLDIAGLEALGQALIDDYGVGTENLSRGKTVKVGIVEHSAFVTENPNALNPGEEWHEDLLDVIPEPGQTIITIAGGNLSPDHGTSTLGQCVAADNGIGVTGIAKDAQGYFFPIVSVEEGGRTLNAMFSALETFDPGDVLNYSIGPGGGGTLVSQQAEWTLVRFCTDSGITSCISAGNDCFNLDDAPQFDDQDSGAIIVGACWPGIPDPPAPGVGRYCRLGFSNHCRDCGDASLVHVAAWGILVTTTGGGDLFGPTNAAGDGINKARCYTRTFNGTSSAAPIIAGLAACLQGLSKQFYGLPLPPTALRDAVISGNTFPQCDIPNPQAIPGSDDQNVCGGDFDPQQQPRLIGGFPRAFEAGVGVITGNFFSGSSVENVKVVTGTLLFGNTNALRQIDGNFLTIQTVQKSQGSQGTGTPPAINYIAGGQTTDIEVTNFTGVVPGEVTGIAVQVVTTTTAQYVIMGVYVYDWVGARWTLIPQIDISPNGNFNYGGLLVNKAPNHVSPEGVVYVRVWTCGLGNVPQHKVFHDFVDVFISDQPGFNPFGGGGEG